MKKITLLIMLFLCMVSYGQIWKVTSCGGGLTTNTYGPMNSVSDVNATSRIASIYPASQLTGIAGKTLNAAYFNRLTATGSVAGTPNFKIYLKETTSTDWGSGALDWATAITGATLVYDSNPVTAIGSSSGWKSFTFLNNFVYSGTANLAVIMEYSNSTASTTIGWEYEYSTPCISDTNNNTTKYSNNTSGTPAASLASSNYRRTMIGFDYNVSCNAPTGLSTANLLTTTTDITWVASTSAPADGYEYIVSTTATAPTSTSTPTGTTAAGVTTKSLTGLPSGRQHYFWVRAICSSTDKSFWSAQGSFTTQVSCFPPTGLATAGLTATATDITWVAPTSAPAEGYEYILSTSSTAPNATATPTGTVGAGITSKSLTGLPQGTQHYFWVRSVCGTNDKSTWASGTFTTPCSVLVPTVTQAFDTFPPACWTRSAAGFATGPTGTGNGSWGADGFLNVGSTGAIKINIYSTATNATGWVVSPVINMTAGNYRAKFKVGATMFNATTPVAAMGSDDVFIFAASQDGGTTWTAVNTWNATNTPSNAGSLYVVNLPAYTSATTKFAFFGTSGSTNDSLDYEIFVDDFTVEAIPSCEAPINLRASGVTATVATITWDAISGSAGYEYVIDNVATNPSGAGTSASGTSFTTSTPLTGATTYYVHVRNNCGSEFSSWTTFSFVTLPFPPANDNCAGAVTLTTNANFTCTNITSATLAGATASGESTPTSVGIPDDDVWFKFVATSTNHRITVSDVTGTPTDLVHELLGGSCGGGLYNLAISDPNESNVADLTIGETYYIRVFSLAVANNPSTNFKICIGTPPPPPTNDNCSGAIVLGVNSGTTCTVKGTGTLVSATDSGVVTTAPLTAVGTPNDDVWYSFVATSTAHTITLSNKTGTPTDLVNEIFQGTCAGLVSLKVSDPDINVVTGLTIGATYYVRVYSYGTAAGASTTFDICITSQTPPAVPANDNATGAIALTVNAAGSCTTTKTGTTVGATASAETAPTCNSTGADDDVWYTFVATDANTRFTYTAVSTGIVMNTVLYTGTPGSLTQLSTACLSGNIVNFTGLTVGTTYYARVYTDSSNPALTSTFTLCVAITPTPPANDDCAGAVLLVPGATLTCTTPLSGTTLGATQSLVGCAGTADDDVWYKFVATATGHSIIITNVSGNTDIVTEVFGSCGGTSLKCQDTPNSPIELTGLTVGNTYFFRVYTYGTGVVTAFTVCVGTTPPPPAPPANDLCSAAISLTAGGAFATNPVVGTTAGATSTTGLTFACQTNRADEVWYTVVVPASGSINIETKAVTGSALTDTVLSVFSGTCQTLTELDCDDDDGDTNYSLINLTGQTPGATLYIGVWRYANSATNTGQFQVSAYHSSLSAPTFDSASFKAYPNPVKDVLKLSYSQDMTSVSVFNLLGQQVINKSLNASEAQVDMSNLAAGTYLVKVVVDNQVKTIKVVKQ